MSQWELRVITSTLLEAQKNVRDEDALILVLNIIGSAGGVTFWDQSQSEVKQNQTKPIQPWLDFHPQLKISV